MVATHRRIGEGIALVVILASFWVSSGVLVSDEAYYAIQARQLVRDPWSAINSGKDMSEPYWFGYIHPPILPAIIAAGFLAFGEKVWAGKLMVAIVHALGTLAVSATVWHLTRKHDEDVADLMAGTAAVLFTLNRFNATFGTMMFTGPVYSALTAITMYGFVARKEAYSATAILAALSRSMGPFVAVLTLAYRRIILTGLVLMTSLVWMARNRLVFGVAQGMGLGLTVPSLMDIAHGFSCFGMAQHPHYVILLLWFVWKRREDELAPVYQYAASFLLMLLLAYPFLQGATGYPIVRSALPPYPLPRYFIPVLPFTTVIIVTGYARMIQDARFTGGVGVVLAVIALLLFIDVQMQRSLVLGGAHRVDEFEEIAARIRDEPVTAGPEDYRQLTFFLDREVVPMEVR